MISQIRECVSIDHWTVNERGALLFKDRLVVPNVKELLREIMDKAHKSKYSVHPGETKMFRDLKRKFLWRNMRREIATYVSKCLICQ